MSDLDQEPRPSHASQYGPTPIAPVSTRMKIATVILLAIALGYGVAIVVFDIQWILSPYRILFVFGAVLTVVGLMQYLRGLGKDPAAQLTFGSFRIAVKARLILLLLGIGAMGYVLFLEANAFRALLLRDDAIKNEVAQLVPTEYRRILLEATMGNDKPKEEFLMDEAENLYEEGDYVGCLDAIRKISTQDQDLLDRVLFRAIMARYNVLLTSVRRLEPIGEAEMHNLESQFKGFMEERRESPRFCTIHYWLGHFYLQVCRDPEKALAVFDEITDRFAYSNWVQGSLYYSAILHHRKGTQQDVQRAVENLKILAREDGLLKIVETDRTVDASAAAQRLLEQWGITLGPKFGLRKSDESYKDGPQTPEASQNKEDTPVLQRPMAQGQTPTESQQDP